MMLKLAASGGVMIDWGAIGLVFVAALAASLVIVGLFSVALRLLATGTSRPQPGGEARNPALTAVAYLGIGVCGVVVLYGLYLVIPQFH